MQKREIDWSSIRSIILNSRYISSFLFRNAQKDFVAFFANQTNNSYPSEKVELKMSLKYAQNQISNIAKIQ